MSMFNLNNPEQHLRSQKIAQLETTSYELYKNIIPEEMTIKYLNEIYETIFGVELIEIYLDRNVFEAKSILVSDFATDGFFWAQNEEEALSDEYKNVYELINTECAQRKITSIDAKWCIANFQGEWFRAYIDKNIGDDKVRVFFIDYGTFADLDRSETRELDDDVVWVLPPLAIPCVLKDIRKSQVEKFKELQYQIFKVKSLKMIEKNCIFEVDLMLETGESVVGLI